MSETNKKMEKVVTGKVITKKKSAVSKAAADFISEDLKNIKSYAIGDVLIPAIKKAIWDIFTNGLDMALYGGNGKSRSKSASNYVSYDQRYRSGNRSVPDKPKSNGYNHDDIILDSRDEAERVLQTLCDAIETYGTVSVADLYDLVGITGPYTANKYGWTNLRNAEPIRVRDGYLLKMPKALPID